MKSLQRFKITIESTNKYSVVTIVNWNDYQGDDSTKQPKNQPKQQQTNNQQITNNQPHLKKEENRRSKKETDKEKSSPADAAWASAGLTREQYEELKNQ